MQLSSEQISQFQLLYKKRFGKEISREEAIDKGIKLVRFVELILEPLDYPEKLQNFNIKPIPKP